MIVLASSCSHVLEHKIVGIWKLHLHHVASPSLQCEWETVHWGRHEKTHSMCFFFLLLPFLVGTTTFDHIWVCLHHILNLRTVPIDVWTKFAMWPLHRNTHSYKLWTSRATYRFHTHYMVMFHFAAMDIFHLDTLFHMDTPLLPSHKANKPFSCHSG